MDKIGNGPIVGETARDYLENRRYTDYYDYKKKLLRWLQTMGKNPEKAEGYADSTLANVTYKVDLFNVWNWKLTEELDAVLRYEVETTAGEEV